MVVEVTPIAFASIKWKYNIVYASTSFIDIFPIYFLYLEIKDRSLEEIDEVFL